jgi:hypothetical protein
MPQPRFEIPSGAVDGANLLYTTSTSYKPGTLAVFLNGLLQEASLDDGWAETDPVAGTFTMKEAPRSSGPCPDVIQVFFLDTSPVSPETEITPITGTINAVDDLSGELLGLNCLFGAISVPVRLSGTFLGVMGVVGTIREERALSGVLELCD